MRTETTGTSNVWLDLTQQNKTNTPLMAAIRAAVSDLVQGSSSLLAKKELSEEEIEDILRYRISSISRHQMCKTGMTSRQPSL